MFDAFGNDRPLPLAFSVGPATHLRGLSRLAFTTHATLETVLVLNAGPGYVVGQLGQLNPGVSITVTDNVLMTSAGFDTAVSASSPDTAMATRFSCRLRNTTKAQDVAGYALAMNVAAGIVLATTADWDALVSYVSSHPRCTTYSSHELRDTTQWNSFPVDQGKFHSFVAPGLDVAGWRSTVTDPAMSTMVFVFPPGTAQDYELTVAASYYGRYRVTGPLAHSSRLPPSVPLQIMNQARDAAEIMGTIGTKIMTNPAAMQLLRGAGSALYNSLMSAPRPAFPALTAPPLLPMLVD
jgi:hypothetical protein